MGYWSFECAARHYQKIEGRKRFIYFPCGEHYFKEDSECIKTHWIAVEIHSITYVLYLGCRFPGWHDDIKAKMYFISKLTGYKILSERTHSTDRFWHKLGERHLKNPERYAYLGGDYYECFNYESTIYQSPGTHYYLSREVMRYPFMANRMWREYQRLCRLRKLGFASANKLALFLVLLKVLEKIKRKEKRQWLKQAKHSLKEVKMYLKKRKRRGLQSSLEN